MPTKHFSSALIFIALLLGLSPVALRADSFTWTDIGAGINSASGTLTAHSVADGEYVVDSGSGTFNGDSINLVAGLDNGAIVLSPSGLFIVDNVLYLSSNPTLDIDGLIFADSLGNELNIWGNGTPGSYSTYTEIGGSYALEDDASTFSIVPTAAAPEPSALVLLGAGLLALVGLTWRRRSQATRVPSLS